MKATTSTTNQAAFLRRYLKTDADAYRFLKTALQDASEVEFVQMVREVGVILGWLPAAASSLPNKGVAPSRSPVRPSRRVAL